MNHYTNMKKKLITITIITVFSLGALAKEPEPRLQDWAFHAWMAKVAEVAKEKGYVIEDAECDFIDYWGSTPDNQEITPEAALERHRTAIATLNKQDEDEQTRFDNWWEELKRVAPVYGFEIDQIEDDADREYFFHHGFPEGQTPAQAIVARQEADAKRHVKEARDAIFTALEDQAALTHGLTAEETETFHDWAKWQRDEVGESPEEVTDPEPPNAMSGEQAFEAWKRNVEEDCGP